MEFVLTKTLKHGDEDITTLTLREPTVQDLENLGYIYDIEPNSGRLLINTKVASKYISTLAAVPPSVVKQLCLSDYQKLIATVITFFTGQNLQ